MLWKLASLSPQSKEFFEEKSIGSSEPAASSEPEGAASRTQAAKLATAG
jgi:hypothetical protein